MDLNESTNSSSTLEKVKRKSLAYTEMYLLMNKIPTSDGLLKNQSRFSKIFLDVVAILAIPFLTLLLAVGLYFLLLITFAYALWELNKTLVRMLLQRRG